MRPHSFFVIDCRAGLLANTWKFFLNGRKDEREEGREEGRNEGMKERRNEGRKQRRVISPQTLTQPTP